jgi:phage N-6-adenine-methyltransferase
MKVGAATAVFSSQSDEWETPDELFAELSKEFYFTLDAAANAENTKCEIYFGPGSWLTEDALSMPNWGIHAAPGAVWLNPPYSMVKQFVEKAAFEASMGATIVLLLPARTDTKWFHQYVYNRPGVEVRFLKGRLKFKGGKHSAPFPSMVVVMWGRRGTKS